MRSFLSFLSLLLIAANFSSCKKDPPTAAATVILEMTVVKSKAELKWQVNGSTEGLRNYTVYVKTDANGSSEREMAIGTVNTLIVDVPVSPYVAYRISANYASDDNTLSNRKVYSEYKEYNRNEIKLFDINPMDVLFDDNRLYIFDEDGTIAKYNVSTKQVEKQVNIGQTTSYADIAMHNGQKEIYVPRTNGWISVLNTDLEKTDEINVGTEAHSVVYHNGYLYTTVKAPGSAWKEDGKPRYYNLHVYNRTTKQLVNNDNNNEKNAPERIKKLGGTNVELFGVIGNGSLTPAADVYDLYYLKYDVNGNYISQQKGQAGFLVTPIIMEAYPDGSKIVTGIRGRRYNKALTLEGLFSDIDVSETYTSGFGFNAQQNLLYIGRYDKTIDVVNLADNSIKRTINTIGYPHKIFYGSGNIICVSRNEYPASIGVSGMIQRSPFMVEVFQ